MEKKKKILLIVCGAVVAAAIIAVILFLVLTRSVKPSATESAPKNIDGEWKVVAYNQSVSTSDDATYTPNQYITLSDGTFGYYQGETTIATAKYTFTSGNKDYATSLSAPFYRCILTLTESSNPVLPGTLVVKYYTENTVELVDEAGGKEWRMIKLDGTRSDYKKADAAYIQRAWKVVLKGHEPAEMTLTFGETSVAVSGAGNLNYVWDEGGQFMDITGMGRAYVMRPKDNILSLVVLQGQDGKTITVWELSLA